MTATSPIGVFDSGVGGLSVLRDIRNELPGEDLLYVADSLHAPYGDKSPEFIQSRALAITEFLLGQQAKAIVVACNTATSAAAALLRARFSVPIIAMEPAVKPAALSTQTGVVGVLATRGTLSSENFTKLATRFGEHAEILVQPCPGLVEQIETGDLAGEKTKVLLKQYLQPLLDNKTDTIVLGCTHYPFLIPLIREFVGPKVTIIDPAPAVARELHRRLAGANLLSPRLDGASQYFWTSAPVDKTGPIIAQLWGARLKVKSLPVEFC
ncbi:MAG: glutamate racemase [Methylococcales bacterium]|nr:glutamate racemase [Methylococcaceae bacterium]